MTSETILLSAVPPEARAGLLEVFELHTLRQILHASQWSMQTCIDQIVASDKIASQIEITISYEHF